LLEERKLSIPPETGKSGPGLIYKKIPLIMAEMGAVGKDQFNSFHKFKFRGIDDVYNALQKVMAKHGVFTVPEIVSRHRSEVSTKSGKAHMVVNQFRYHFYAEDGSSITADADGEAFDNGDKASNKAAAVAHKYALLQVFCIPTEVSDDPDKYTHEMVDERISPSQQSALEDKLSKVADPSKLDGWLKSNYGLDFGSLSRLTLSQHKNLLKVLKKRDEAKV